jgi:hypothetical protein
VNIRSMDGEDRERMMQRLSSLKEKMVGTGGGGGGISMLRAVVGAGIRKMILGRIDRVLLSMLSGVESQRWHHREAMALVRTPSLVGRREMISPRTLSGRLVVRLTVSCSSPPVPGYASWSLVDLRCSPSTTGSSDHRYLWCSDVSAGGSSGCCRISCWVEMKKSVRLVGSHTACVSTPVAAPTLPTNPSSMPSCATRMRQWDSDSDPSALWVSMWRWELDILSIGVAQAEVGLKVRSVIRNLLAETSSEEPREWMCAVCGIVGKNCFEVSLAMAGGGDEEGSVVRAGWSRSGWGKPTDKSVDGGEEGMMWDSNMALEVLMSSRSSVMSL